MTERFKLFGLLGSLLVLLVLINSTIHVLESKASITAQILADPQTVSAANPSAEPALAPAPSDLLAPLADPGQMVLPAASQSADAEQTSKQQAATPPIIEPVSALPLAPLSPLPIVSTPASTPESVPAIPLAPLAPLSPPLIAPAAQSKAPAPPALPQSADVPQTSDKQPESNSGGSIVITPSPAPSPAPAPAPSVSPSSEIPAPVTVAPPATEPSNVPAPASNTSASPSDASPSLLAVPLSPQQIVDQIAEELQKRNLACKDAEGRKDVMVNDKIFADAVQVTSRVGKNECPDSCKAEIFFDLDPGQQRKGLCKKIESSCYDGGDDGIKFSAFESCEAYYQTRVFSGDFQSRKEDEDFKKAKKDMKEKYTESKNTCIIQAAILCKNNDKENLQKCLRQNVLPCFDWDAYLNNIEPIKSFDALSELGNKVLQWRNENGR